MRLGIAGAKRLITRRQELGAGARNDRERPISEQITLKVEAIHELVRTTLVSVGMHPAQADAIADVIAAGERDECKSHGLYRLLGILRTVESGMVALDAVPVVTRPAPGLVRADARYTFAPLAVYQALPALRDAARTQGIAALAITNCFHFSALWAEVEPLAEEGLVALAMTPSHSWVAPAGGTRPVFGTNPIALGWPREGHPPFVFDFATSAVARGEIELHRRKGESVPLGWGLDASGEPSTDPDAILRGAMMTFGGHKGSALAAMIELLAGALVGDLTSLESRALDGNQAYAPLHGELIIAMDPERFLGAGSTAHLKRAEMVFSAISGQGARLPSERRYAARARNLRDGVSVPKQLLDEIAALAERSSRPNVREETAFTSDTSLAAGQNHHSPGSAE